MLSGLNKDLVFLNALRVVAIVFFASIGVSMYNLYRLISTCHPTIYKSIPSPDASRLAVVYDRGCGGATVGFYTKVSIAPADRSFSDDRNPPFLNLSGKHDLLAVKWVTDKRIEIELPKVEETHRYDQNAGDITVEYK